MIWVLSRKSVFHVQLLAQLLLMLHGFSYTRTGRERVFSR